VYFRLTTDPITLDDAAGRLDECDQGAVVTFSGHIRPEDAYGHPLSHMEYEAYEEMARSEMGRIFQTLQERWGVSRAVVLHRVGRVEVGEPSVVIAVASGHRPEAFAACRYCIDELKRTVPLWKHEVLQLQRRQSDPTRR